jgi:hypothetical protein
MDVRCQMLGERGATVLAITPRKKFTWTRSELVASCS